MKNKRPLHSVQTGTQVANISFDEILLCQAVSYATSVCFSSICLFQPIVDAFDSNRLSTKSTLINLTVEEFPIPSDAVSWEMIVDFRNNDDSKKKKEILIDWINDMAINPIDPKEFQLRLKILIREYQEEFDKYKIQYKKGIFRTVVKSTLTIAEKLVTLNWSELLNPIFEIQDNAENLMKIERKLKNRQIGYLMKSKRKFG